MKILNIRIALFMLITCTFVHAQSIVDPMADFLKFYDRDPGDKVYRLCCDLENNGGQAVFLAFSHDIGSDGDGIWTLYLKRGNKFIKPLYITETGAFGNNCPTFNIHRYKIEYIKEIKKFGLLTSEIFYGHSAGTQLEAIIVEGNNFTMLNVGPFKNYDPTVPVEKIRFPDPPTPPIEILNP